MSSEPVSILKLMQQTCTMEEPKLRVTIRQLFPAVSFLLYVSLSDISVNRIPLSLFERKQKRENLLLARVHLIREYSLPMLFYLVQSVDLFILLCYKL